MRRGDPACGPRGVRAAATTVDRPHASRGRVPRRGVLAVALLALVAPAAVRGDSGNQFRGPAGDGRAATAKLPSELNSVISPLNLMPSASSSVCSATPKLRIAKRPAGCPAALSRMRTYCPAASPAGRLLAPL